MKKLITFSLLLASFFLSAQNAALDPTFGNGGIAVHPYPHTAEIQCFAIDNNSNIISAGYAGQGGAGTNYQLTLTKTDTNGMLDASFGTNGKVTTVIGRSEYPGDIVIQPDGKIIVAGQVSFAGGGNNAFAIRYNSDGSLDTSFANNGIYQLAGSRNFFSIILLPNGSVILGGHSDLNDILVKLDSNGIEDSQFGTNGVLSLDSTNFKFLMQESILLRDGSIFCVGYEYSDINSHSKSAYCKIDTQGNFDATFGTNGKVTLDLFTYDPIINVTEFLITARELSNGQIIIGGSEFNNFLLKINPDGSLDSTFGTNGVKDILYSFRRRGVAVQTNGKIILGGMKTITTGNSGYTVTRLDSDGNLDITFNNGKGFVDIDVSSQTDWLNHIKLQSNDTLIIGGSSVLNSNHNFTLARLLLDTPLSVEEPLEQFVKVYPIPFAGHFFVEDYEQIIKEIKIFDNTGKLIKKISNTNPLQEIHADFSSGIYFVTIETKDGRTINKKMIKN